MAMDDVSGGGGGVYTPTWRREEEEREWAAAQEEKRRAERHESAGYSYNPDDDPRAHAQMTYQTASGTYTTPKVYGKAEQETGMSWEAPDSDSGMMINNDAENRDDQGSGSWDQVSGTEGQGAGTKTQLPVITVAEPESKEEIKGSGKKAEEEKPVVYTGGSTNANTGTGAKGTGASGTKAALTENGLPEGYMDWTAEQWKEWQRDSANREAAAAAANRQAEAARAERLREELYRGRELMQPISYSGTTGTGASGEPSPGRDYYSSNPVVRRYTPGTAEYDALNGRGSRTQGYDPAIRSAGGGQSTGPAVGSQQWLADNGLSWSGNQGAVAGNQGAYTYQNNPQYQTDLALGLVDGSFSPMVLQEMYGDRISDRVENYEPNVPTSEGKTPLDVDAYNRAINALNQQGIYGEEAVNQATQMVRDIQGAKEAVSRWVNPNQGGSEDRLRRLNRFNEDNQAGKYTVEIPADSYKIPGTETYVRSNDEVVADNYRVGTQGNQRFDARQGQTQGTGAGNQGSGISYQGKGSSQVPNPDRPGAEAEVNSWNKVEDARANTKMTYKTAGKNQEAGSTDQTAKAGTNTGGTNSKGTGTGTSTKGSGSDKAVPDGSKYYNPSYGQGGKVVKAPYKQGGYTEDEIMKMGNKAYGTAYGKNAYEGYYRAPDGHYYPVDQEKANYYRQTGSYRGWEEGMRDYWNTFGTFYGYRPDWKTAGRNVSRGSGGGGRGGYSYGGGGSSYAGSNRSYGAGSTANNGLYWNPNTSWNI